MTSLLASRGFGFGALLRVREAGDIWLMIYDIHAEIDLITSNSCIFNKKGLLLFWVIVLLYVMNGPVQKQWGGAPGSGKEIQAGFLTESSQNINRIVTFAG